MTRRSSIRGALLAGFLLLVSCQDPQAPGRPASEPPALHIQDGAHNGGRAGFYFLPPLVPEPGATGAFDPALLPFLVVRICEWSGTDCVGNPIASFTGSTGPGSTTLRVDTEAEHYIVNWHTNDFDLNPDHTYRIQVIAGGVELGHADVDVVSSGKELKNVNTNEYVALKDGRTLPIKFRVEQGAVIIVGPTGGTVTTPDGAITLNVPSGALSEGTAITITPQAAFPPDVALVPGTVFEFGPDGTTFNVPARLTITYDPAAVPGNVFETSLRLFHAAGVEWESVVGSSVDVNTHTVTGSISGFSSYAVLGTELQVTPPGTVSAALPGPFAATNYLVSGQRVAWFDGRNIDLVTCPTATPQGQCFWDLFVFDAMTGLEQQVTPPGAYPFSPGNQYLASSGDRLWWGDNRSSPQPNAIVHEELYTLDLATGVETLAAGFTGSDAFGLHRSFVASGDRLAWMEGRQGGLAIVVLDLVTGIQTPFMAGLTPWDHPSLGSSRGLAMSGDRVAWRAQIATGVNSLFTLDTQTGVEMQIPTGGGTLWGPALSGDRIVWAEVRGGNADVYMFDLSTGTETRITNDPSPQTFPDISGDRIVWTDFRNAGGGLGNGDIYMFDLGTGLEGQITSDPSLQVRSRISGDRVVWTDARNGGVLVLFQIR